MALTDSNKNCFIRQKIYGHVERLCTNYEINAVTPMY